MSQINLALKRLYHKILSTFHDSSFTGRCCTVLYISTLYAHQTWFGKATLKGQCHEIFDTFLDKKKLHLGPIYVNRSVSAQSKTTLTPCQRSQQLHQHDVSMVNDYAVTPSAQSTTMWTSCQCSQRLRRHCVSIVCQRSQLLLGHTENYFTLEKVKNKEKCNTKL